ncbi:MAG TPA: tetratricopeptide repeat protein [Saprospiraceae bacterium]|nr:tetratricopeptide repeat protein [Saprospiraceae bacterium]
MSIQLYMSHKMEDAKFVAQFTLRQKEYQEIIKNLSQQGQSSLQHFLITGKRGMGKSTLLRRIAIEAEQQFTHKLMPIYLGTEQLQISKLFKLWETILKDLASRDHALKLKLDDIPKTETYEKAILQILIDYILTKQKSLLLLIDNFDNILNNLNLHDQHVFREILIENPIQIIGNCMFYDEKFISYDAPFYDFFKRIALQKIDLEETKIYFNKLAEIQGIQNFQQMIVEKSAKLETLQILCGGVPRTLAILFEILFKNSFESAIEYLNKIIDEVTPLYQSRLNMISPLQREILYHLALIWDRCSVSDLKEKMYAEANLIGGQLKILEENGYVESFTLEGFERLKYYEIEERFFNIWILMSESPMYESRRVIWLTRWLETFYEKEELVDMASGIIDDNNIKGPTKSIYVQAILQSDKLGKNEKSILARTSIERQLPSFSTFEQWIEPNQIETKEEELYEIIQQLFENKDYKSIINFISPIVQKLEIQYQYCKEEALGNQIAILYFGLGIAYNLIKKIDMAEKYFILSIDKGNINSLYDLALLYHDTSRKVDAEKYYLLAIDKGYNEALNNLGFLYHEDGRVSEAEKYYLLATEKGNVNALFNLANLYREIGRAVKAEKYYQIAIEKGHIKALFNLANLYEEIGKEVEAEKYFLLAIEKGDKTALNNLANLYKNTGRELDAEKYYLLAIENGYVYALSNLAWLYFMSMPEKINNAILYFNQYLSLIENEQWSPLLSIFYLRNLEFELAENHISKYTHNSVEEKYFPALGESLKFLLVFKQKQVLLNLFQQNPHLQDKYKVLYFTLLQSFKKEYPKLWQRVPSELKKPIEDLKKWIHTMQKSLGLGKD